MNKMVRDDFFEARSILEEFISDAENFEKIETAGNLLVNAFKNKKKVISCGNGGSMCDAMHFAEELTGIFRSKRRALPAIALSCAGHLTCTANDLGFDRVFARAVEAYGQKGDLFVSLTTSGNSSNLLQAVQTAKELQLKTITFLGKTGGKLKHQSDLEWLVPGFRYSDRIQEAHMAAIHIIIEMVEERLFGGI
jgi:D-sedoheptulose 7-phosphate isomerase